jgi:glycerophosphoryl diester phosphodiesterase
LGFSAQAQVWKQSTTLRIGHRGARGLVDENTLESFKKAIEIGVDDVEFDIQRTKDGVFVIMHDQTVDRTTDGHGAIKDMTVAEFKKLKTKSGFTPPTLEETLAYLKTTNVGVILDIKYPDPKCIPAVYALVEKYGLVSRTVFETSYPKVGEAIEKFNPDLVSALYPAWPPSALYYAKKYKMDCVSIYYPFATPLYRKLAEKNGFKFVVWTVDKEKQIKYFENKLHVDGIMTDDPNLFKSADSGCGCGK